APPALPSCPTRRSSDLWLELEPGAGVEIAKAARAGILTVRPDLAGGEELLARAEERLAALQAGDTPFFRLRRGAHHLELGVDPRSEEHTSELQSRANIV